MRKPLPRVFISSVMTDYGHFRDAAAEGIRQAGCEVVRAEDFPADGSSPRNACLDGVRSADAVVLLLGERYGFVSPSGRGATEEEYEEARRTQQRVLVFIEDITTREPEQQAFVERVQGYVDGHYRKAFQDANELTALVRDSVAAADLNTASNFEAQAEARMAAAFKWRPSPSERLVWLQTVWVPVRDEEVVDPIQLGEAAFQRQVQGLAHGCEPPLLSYEHSKRVDVGRSILTIEQGDPNQRSDGTDRVVLKIHADGSLAISQNVSGTEARDHVDSVFDMYSLSPRVVEARLRRAWGFAGGWWHDRDSYLRYDPLLYNLTLLDVGMRRWGELERSSPGGIAIPGECPHNPLVVFDRPRRVSRSDMHARSPEVDRSLTMLERLFRDKENRW